MKTRERVRWSILMSLVLLALAAAPVRAEDLVELYLRARDYDPDFQTARLSREVADEVLKGSKAEAMPILSGNAEGSMVYQDVLSSDNVAVIKNLPGAPRNWISDRYGITLTVPIYRAEIYTAIPRARAEVRKATSEYRAAEQDLIYRLARAHFGYLAAQDNLDLAAAERTAIGRQLAETEQRLGSGLTTITDVHDARSRFALAQAREIDAVDLVGEARQAIAEITGLRPEELKSLSETFPLVEPDSPDVNVWVEASMFQNPSIQALQAAIEMAGQDIRRQRGARIPNLELVANWNIDDVGGSNLLNQGGYSIENGNIALRLGIPILDSGRTSALVRGAQLQQQVARQNLEREKRQIEREVRTSFMGVVSGIDRVEALVKSVFSNQAAVSAREEGLRSGLNTGLEVLDARRELFSARRDLLAARYQYILNSLHLKQAAGILGERDLREINAYLQ